MGRFVDLAGQRFGRWVVLSLSNSKIHGKPAWVCQCNCGNVKAVPGHSLRSGASTSCGCYNREVVAETLRKTATKHGQCNTADYKRWMSMKGRCDFPTHPAYPRYGARGITVCERWRKSFVDYLSDIGPRPSPKHSLDRIDNNGNYEPGNVRWSTYKEQALNRHNSWHLTIGEVTKPLADWASEFGINKETVRYRISRGMSPQEALTRPPRRGKELTKEQTNDDTR